MNFHNVIIFVILFALTGCSPLLTSQQIGPEPIKQDAGVAVLPFENMSGREGASEKLTEYVILALQKEQKLRIIEFGQVYEQMRKFRIRSAALLTQDQMDSLSVALQCRYLLAGSVLEFRETDNQFLGKVPQLSLNLRLIDCQSHETIWIGAANARGDQRELIFGIGVVRSLEKLAKQVVDKTAKKLSAASKR